MAVTQRRVASPAFVDALHASLPRSEFAVALLDDARMVLEVGDHAERIVAGAVAVDGMATLSGAPVMVALVADASRWVEQLVTPLLPLLVGAGAIELLGPGSAAADLARELAPRVGGVAGAVMEQRLLAAEDVTVPWHVPGWMRPMRPADHALVATWMEAFSVEALGTAPRGVDAWGEQLAAAGRSMRLWERDGTPVAVAMARSTTPVSSRIGPVYTPPGQRRRGYAAALTAHLTRTLLDGGDRRVVLLTDVTNPTSNNVYRGIGYADVDRHASWVVRTAA